MRQAISNMVVAAVAAAALLSIPATSSAQSRTAQTSKAAALAKLTPENSALVYVDYVTGLDNLMNTLPSKQYRNNIAAFAKFSSLFKMPTAVMGEENDYYGTFLPGMRAVIAAGGKTFAPRSSVSVYTPDFAKWLKETGRKNVIIGGISIDNRTLHTSLDLLRNGYNA
jgi:Isochorismatase family